MHWLGASDLTDELEGGLLQPETAMHPENDRRHGLLTPEWRLIEAQFGLYRTKKPLN